MKYFKYTITLDQGTQMPDGEWDVVTNTTESKLEEITDHQDKVLAEFFDSLFKDNKSKTDKAVDAIR